MGDVKSLLDLAAALADGQPVDWASAERLAECDADRELLAGLRFIAAVAEQTGPRRPSAAASPDRTQNGRVETGGPSADEATVEPAQWGPLSVIECVGQGRFGTIYRAWDPRLDREVALKLLRRREREDEGQTAIQEGRLLARVRHPNVVTVYGAERIEGRVGVWMEYVHGRTLEQELAETGPFDVERVTAIGIELGGALSTVHRAGVIHRDVKAQNVMVDREGRLVLTDFGAGIELEETPDGDVRELAGTPLCVAPEVLAGQPAVPASDTYSLGVLLYHLLTGSYPVQGRTLKDVRDAHAKGKRVPLADARPDLPRDLTKVIDRALDSDPQRRPSTPDALAGDLSALTSTRSGIDRTQRAPAEWRTRGAALALLTVVALAAAALTVWRGTGTPIDALPSAVNLAAGLSGAPLQAPADLVDATGRLFTVIEFPGSTRTDVFEINDRGAMVGSYIDASDTTHGFLLVERNFATVDFPGAVRTRPTGLNDDSAVVGDYSDANETVRGFLFQGQAFTVIEFPGATFTRAEEINEAGDVVGDYKDASGVAHGFLLSRGTFSSIDVPGARYTRAIGLNNLGHIVGDYQDSKGVAHGFLFANGRFTAVDVPGATVTQAFGINMHGTIVGGYGFPSRHGFSFTNQAFTPIDVPGAFQTAAAAIDASGSIVGSYLGGTPLRTRGFILNR